MEFSVMTLNLRYNTKKDGDNAWPYRVKKVAKLVQAWNPHVIGTQEGNHAMLLELNEEIDQYNWLGFGRRGGQKSDFCAIFYKKDELDVLDSGQFWLSKRPDKAGSKSWNSRFPRMCIWAHFQSKHNPDKQFIMYNTHLDHKSQPARINGAMLIWERMLKHRAEQSKPFLLTGDMNAKPQNQVIRFLRGKEPLQPKKPYNWFFRFFRREEQLPPIKSGLRDCFSILPESEGRTFHGFRGGSKGKPIDYIFFTNDVNVIETNIDRRQFDYGYPTDHYPVIAKIII